MQLTLALRPRRFGALEIQAALDSSAHLDPGVRVGGHGDRRTVGDCRRILRGYLQPDARGRKLADVSACYSGTSGWARELCDLLAVQLA